MKRILFYSSVRDLSSFVSQRFYVIDILLLKELGYDVIITNKIIDFIRFYRYDVPSKFTGPFFVQFNSTHFP